MKPHPKSKKPRKAKPGKSPTHLDLIRQLPCLLSGGPAEAAHLRFADAAHGKTETGAGRKPDDMYCLPLAPALHRLNKGCQHDCGDERAWWASMGVPDPVAVAKQLWGKTRLQMERVIVMNTPWDAATKAKILTILKGTKS